MNFADLNSSRADRSLQGGNSVPQKNNMFFERFDPVLHGLRNTKAAFDVLNNFINERISLLLAKHCPAVLAIVGHSRARLIHASGATTLSDGHAPVNLADGDLFDVQNGQQAQRAFLRNVTGFWIGCFVFGYFVAYMLHALSDRSAQW